jgi:hypothetical protein
MGFIFMAERIKYFDSGDVQRRVVSDANEPDKFAIETSQNMEPVIDLVNNLREVHKVVGHRKSKAMTPVAEVPMQVYEQAVREGWVNDRMAWRRWLNSPENKVFRITDGKM